MRYKKRTEYVDAIQFTGSNGKEIEEWSNYWIYFDSSRNRYVGRVYGETVNLIEGNYVIKKPDGSVSIMNEDMFEKEYVTEKELTFSEALALLKDGHKVRRASWKQDSYLQVRMPESTSAIRQCVCMYNEYPETGGLFVYSWSPISMDMFADDWELYE